MPPTQAETITSNQSTVLLIIGLAFALAILIFFGGYFWFLKLEKESREKGRREAEEEVQRDANLP